MAEFKQDQKIFFISPLIAIHNNSHLRSHVPETEGRDFATLCSKELCHIQNGVVMQPSEVGKSCDFSQLISEY